MGRTESSFSIPWFLWLAPIVLCANAAGQRIMASTEELNPWKGGGFGMFAEIHETTFRTLQIRPAARLGEQTGLSQTKLFQTPTPKRYKRTAIAVRTLPRESSLRAFAEELARESWVMIDQPAERGGAFPVLAEEAYRYPERGAEIALRWIELELFEYRYDRDAGQLLRSSLATIKVEAKR